jgi:hypothetical protein
MKGSITGIVIALALCAALAVPAFAAGRTATVENGISVSNVIEERTAPVTEFEMWTSLEGDLAWISEYLLESDTVKVYQCEAPAAVTVTVEANAEIVNWYYNSEVSGDSIANNLEKNQDELFVGDITFTDPGTYLLNDGQTASFGNIFVVIGGEESAPADTPDSPSSWAVESIEAAIEVGLVPETLQSGYTKAATRAEFCALAVALYENAKGEITERSSFSDTNDINVEKAAAIGVVSGMGDNKFSPDESLTREQAATMLSRLAEAVGKPLPAQEATFADKADISSWAAAQVGQVQAAGIMSGVGDNAFSPKGKYTREQSIATILRLWNLQDSDVPVSE